MRYSFFRINYRCYIGYPTKVIQDNISRNKPNFGLDQIEQVSAAASNQFETKLLVSGDKDIMQLSGGLVVSCNVNDAQVATRLAQAGIVVADCREDDIIRYPEYAIAAMNTDQNPEVLLELQHALTDENLQWQSYVHYAALVFGTNRDSIVKQFEEHAADEYSHMQVLQRYLVDAGVVPTLARKSVDADKMTKKDMLDYNLMLEEDAVKRYSTIIKLINNEANPLQTDIQNIQIKEHEHVQDLRLLLR